MRLNVNDDKGFEGVDEETIRKYLVTLAEDEYAILSRGDNDYVQTLLTEEGGYLVEYRAGSSKHHFALRDDAEELDLVVQIFLEYYSEKEGWMKSYDWVIVDFDEDFEGADDLESEPEFIDIQDLKKEH